MDFSNISDRDQQEYIRARFELENLERMEVLSDDEYTEAYRIANSKNDEEVMNQFRNTYIPNSYYLSEKQKLEKIINHINSKDERISNDRILYERQERANREREYLRKIKAYYTTENFEIMRNIDIDSMSDDSVIAMYRVISSGLKESELEKIINSDVKLVNNYESTNNRIRLYAKYYDKISKQISDFKVALLSDENINVELSTTLKTINDEFKRLDEYSKRVIAEIDYLYKKDNNLLVDMTSLEIKKQTEGLKDTFKKLKINQIDKYNAKVEAINKRIYKLKSMTDLAEDVMKTVNGLVSLNRCNVNITKWDQYGYLRDLDYKSLINTSYLLDDIESNINTKENENKEEIIGLKDDLDHIENELVNITLKLRDIDKIDNLSFIKQDIEQVKNNINELKIKLDSNKEKIPEEEYAKYLEMLNAFDKRVEELKEKTIKDDINEYKKLFNEIKDIEKETDNLWQIVLGLSEGKSIVKLEIILKQLDGFSNKLENVLNVINKKHDDKELDDTQYSNLINKYNEVNIKINGEKLRIKNDIEELQKDNETSSKGNTGISLDERINKLEKNIDDFGRKINILDTPIDDNIRKQIDKIIDRIHKEINDITSELEKDKENDNTDKLDKLKVLSEKLDNITGNYRKKCPLKVKKIKDAKDFYKKHKKAILIAAGLASLALYLSVGPLLIPSIIEGNLIIMNKAAWTRPALKGINALLGKTIGAKKVYTTVKTADGIFGGYIWHLANGLPIAPDSITTTLLQGIGKVAMSGGILAAPVVAATIKAVKELAKKIKLVKVENTLEDKVHKIKEKVSSEAHKVKDKVEEKKEKIEENKTNKKDKLKTLLNKLIFNPVDDFEKFCKKCNLTKEEAKELKDLLVDKGIMLEEETGKRR